MQPVEQKREHFRIIYPLTKLGVLELKQGRFAILDISQRGIKFALGEKSKPENWVEQQPIKGAVLFLCGERVQVEGAVLRVTEEHVVLVLNEAINLKIMYDEHRFIIQNFVKPDTKT